MLPALALFLGASGVVAGTIGAIYAQATFLPFILMDRVGLTPTQAAARARVDSSKWCNWEGNAEIPSRQELAVIAQVFHQSDQSLLPLQRRAPIQHLRRFFRPDSNLKVARGHQQVSQEELLELKLAGLDAAVRDALERWCSKKEMDLNQAVDLLNELEPEERDRIIQEIWEDMVWNAEPDNN